MPYRITSGVDVRNLTPTQRASRFFAEEPRVLGVTLRKDHSIRLTDSQFAEAKPQLEGMIRDGIIVVTPIGAPAPVAKGGPGTEPGYEVKKAQEEAARIEAEGVAKTEPPSPPPTPELVPVQEAPPSTEEIVQQVEADTQAHAATKKSRKRG